MFKDDSGASWLKLVDSYADRYRSNDYTDAESGVVYVPLEVLYTYGSYGGASDVYLIFNP